MDMNITQAQYVNDIDGNAHIVRITLDGIVMDVPMVNENRHYKEILSQVESGDLTIADAE